MKTTGAEQKVIIADNLTLDFTGLFEEENKATESPIEPFFTIAEYKNAFKTEKARTGANKRHKRETTKRNLL